MKITAITKLKQGDLWELLKKLGWNQSELARRAKVQPHIIGDIINLKRRPTQELAEKIQIAFANEGEYINITELWPESFPGFGRRSLIHEETKNIDPSFLIEEYQKTPLEILEYNEKRKILKNALECAPKRMKKVLEMHWLDGKTLDEIAKEMNISRERARQLECYGFRFIRWGASTLGREVPESTKFIPVFDYKGYGEKKDLNSPDY